MPNDLSTTMVSVLALIGGALLLHFGLSESERSAGGVILGAVTAFWFQHRSTNQVVELSNGNLKALTDRIDRLTERIDAKQ